MLVCVRPGHSKPTLFFIPGIPLAGSGLATWPPCGGLREIGVEKGGARS